MVTQIDMVRQHLESGQGITSMQAFELYGVTRLSDKIFRLRKGGMKIGNRPKRGTNRYGQKCHYDEYYKEEK